MTWIVLKFELEIHVVATYQKILLLYFWAKWFKNFREIKNKKINWIQVEFIICFLWECLLYLMINMFSKLQIFIGSACKCIPRPLRILMDFKFLFAPIFWQFIKDIYFIRSRNSHRRCSVRKAIFSPRVSFSAKLQT